MPVVGFVLLTTNSVGMVKVPFILPPGVPSGTNLWLEIAIVDAAAIRGVALSNAILGVTP